MALDIKDAFTQKIGPLPVIAWGGILGGAFVLYRYKKAASNNAAAIASATPSTYGDIGTAGDFSQGFSQTTPGLGFGSGGVVNGSTGTIPLPTDNQTWGTQAANWAIARGFDPTDVEFALGTYLYGTGFQLNDTQSGILRDILSHFGNPPEGVVIPPPVTPNPQPNPQPPPPVTTPAPTPTISAEAAAAFAAAKTSFVKAQNLANYTHGPIEGPHGIMISPNQLPSADNWIPFDQALVDQNRAQQVANYIGAAVWGPNGLVQPQR